MPLTYSARLQQAAAIAYHSAQQAQLRVWEHLRSPEEAADAFVAEFNKAWLAEKEKLDQEVHAPQHWQQD